MTRQQDGPWFPAHSQSALAAFAADYQPGPADQQAISRAQAAIADCVGVALAGTATAVADRLWSYLHESGELDAGGSAILIGRDRRATPGTAALHNGTVFHALDYDDYCHPANAHLSTMIVPALMAVSDDRDLFSDRFRDAYLVGYEVAAKAGRALPRSKRGPAWHPTGVLGPLGCAAAVARFLGLDPEAASRALGIAASYAAGVRANFGTMTKPLHAGRSAQAGVTAALLARSGFEAAPDALDGRSGFFRAFRTEEPEQVGADVAAAVARPGRALGDRHGHLGLQLKPYPSASATHAAIEAAQRAGAKAGAAAIARVEVGIAAEKATALLAKYQRPRTGLQGKFSAEYCVAAALRWGEIDLGTFTDDKIRDPGIAGLLEKITVGVAAEPLVRDSGEHAATVTVTLASGEAITETMLTGKGKGENFMTREEVLAKFRTTAGAVISQSGAEQLFAAVYAGAAADPRVAGWLQGRAG